MTSFRALNTYRPPSSARPAGSVGDGWTDHSNSWSIGAGGTLDGAAGGSPWKDTQIAREAAAERCVNQRIQVRYVKRADNEDFYVIPRYTGPDDAPNGYLVKSGQVFTLQGGGFGGGPGGNGASIGTGQLTDFQVDVVQTDAATTTITDTTWSAAPGAAFGSGTLLVTNTYTETTAALQGVSGGQGLFWYNSAGTVLLFNTFTGDAAAAAATPAPVAAVAAVTLTMTGPGVTLSPYNWTTGLGGDAARTWNCGAYARFAFTGCVVATLALASPGGGYYALQIDDGAIGAVTPIPSGGSAAGSASVSLPDGGDHVLTVYLTAIPQGPGRWSGANALTIAGLTLGAGGTGRTARTGARRLLIYGDSISEGIAADAGGDNNLTDWSSLVGQAMVRMGWEYGVVACGYSGYSVPVAAGNGGTLAAFVPGSDAASWWNKLDGAGARRTTGSGAAERFVLQPDLVLDVWGANDGIQGAGGPQVQAAVAGLHAALRRAAPNAVILNVVPFGGYVRAAILAAMASLPTDGARSVIDLRIDARQAAMGGVHPTSAGHAAIAPMLLARIMAAYVPLGTARVMAA